MTIFGRPWEPNSLYTKGWLDDGTVCYDFIDDDLFYGCQLCRRGYRHWLCSDKVWLSLPKELHKKVICKYCFLGVRGYLRILKKEGAALV